MAQREKALNDDLRVLGDAHRLGQMTREEYRARRRHLLMSLADSEGATARNSVTEIAAVTVAATSPAKAAVNPAAPRTASPMSPPTVAPAKFKLPWFWITMLAVSLLVAAGALMLF